MQELKPPSAAGVALLKPPATHEREVRDALAAVIETYRLGFPRLDAEQLASIWDHQHEPLIYVAQESEEPILGWAAIQSYLTALPEHLDAVMAKNLDDVRIDVLGDAAIAFFTSRSSVRLKGHPAIKYEPRFSRSTCGSGSEPGPTAAPPSSPPFTH